MLKLFKYEGYKLTIEPEALLLKPIRDIWERDTSPTKDIALMELGFVYFFSDPRSDYQFITDKNDRMKEIKAGEGIPKEWKPDKLVKDFMSFYESFKSSSILLLEDTRLAVDKLRKQLREMNFNERTENGSLVFTLNSMTSTIKQIPTLAKDLNEAENMLKKEVNEDIKMRGSGEKTILEDGF